MIALMPQHADLAIFIVNECEKGVGSFMGEAIDRLPIVSFCGLLRYRVCYVVYDGAKANVTLEI